MAGKLARVAAKRDGFSGKLDGVRASLADVGRERDSLAADKLRL